MRGSVTFRNAIQSCTMQSCVKLVSVWQNANGIMCLSTKHGVSCHYVNRRCAMITDNNAIWDQHCHTIPNHHHERYRHHYHQHRPDRYHHPNPITDSNNHRNTSPNVLRCNKRYDTGTENHRGNFYLGFCNPYTDRIWIRIFNLRSRFCSFF